MGIYPETRTEEWCDEITGDAMLTVTTSTPGLEVARIYRLEKVNETRTNCFCCSCGDREGSDPACRNHGFAAERPCDIHGMPGSAWGNFELNGPGTIDERAGTMPDPVTWARHGGQPHYITSDPTILNVDENGVVTVHGQGTVTVTKEYPDGYSEMSTVDAT